MKRFIFALVFLAGCSGKPSDDSITYFKDSRTDLCYASYGATVANNYTMTCVPCTEKVMNRIANQR